MPPEGSWIRYQLDLRNIKYEAVGRQANRSVSMVSLVVKQVKHSKAVESVLANVLGYASYDELLAAARTQNKGGAA
jgi:hypothetical protein